MSDPGDSATPWRVDLQQRLRRLSVGMTSGLACGFLIGGVGGRLAMLVLRLTSDDRLKGLKTDDEFTIGKFSGETFFLLAVTAVIGALAGALYLGVREWLSERRRPLWAGLFGAAVGGAAIVHPGGIDFTRLEPLWLAIAMFVLIPGGVGAALSALVDRRLTRLSDEPGRLGWLAPMVLVPILAALGPLGLLVLVIVVAGFLAQRQAPELAGLARSPMAVALGRALLLAVFALATVDLVRDAAEIL